MSREKTIKEKIYLNILIPLSLFNLTNIKIFDRIINENN